MAEAARAAVIDRKTPTREGPRPLVREIPEAEPYPVEALGAIRTAVEAIHEHTRAPLAICAQSVLGALALVGQAHADVRLPTGELKPLSLFLLTVGASGERKSAVDRYALQPIYDRETELRAFYLKEKLAFDEAQEIWEARKSQAKSELKGASKAGKVGAAALEADFRALGSPPQPPLLPILVCPEPTFEGYVKLTAQGQPALGLFSAEGGAFIGGYGMSPDHRLKTAAAISSIWDGEPIKRVRAGDDALILPGRRLSVHLMAQPDVAAQMLGDDLLADQGLLSRFLVAAPASTAGTRFFARPSVAARNELCRYTECLGAFVQAPLPLAEGSQNELVPRQLSLSPEAEAIWINFHDFIESGLGEGREFSPIAGLANKAAEHAARIAGLMALWSDFEATEVTGATMANGTMFAQHYLVESLRLREIAATDSHLRLAQRVLDWILEKWTEAAIYPAVIYNECTSRKVRDRKTALRVIGTLEEHGWLTKLNEQVHIRGALRKEAWLIHGRIL